MASSRSKGEGPGGRKPVAAPNLFGTDEEIASRDGRGFGRELPQDNPTTFTKIAPVSGGGSINRAPLQRSGSSDRKQRPRAGGA
jgi:hypothetical protein